MHAICDVLWDSHHLLPLPHHTQQHLNSDVEIPHELTGEKSHDVHALQVQNGQLLRALKKMKGDKDLCSPPGKKLWANVQKTVDAVASKKRLRLDGDDERALRIALHPSVEEQRAGWTWHLTKRLQRKESDGGKQILDVEFKASRQTISLNVLIDRGDEDDDAGMDGVA